MIHFWLVWRHMESGGNGAVRTGRRKPIRGSTGLRRSFVPRVDVLEDRTLPSTLTVINLKDSGSGSLRAALTTANAHPGDTIQFANGLQGTITLKSDELRITANVTIRGPGANQISISGSDASRIFEIAANLNVTINDLTITQGYAVYEGGGILNDGSNLTLSGDNLTHNVVTESSTDASAGATDLYANGGALDSLAGTLTITDCQITDNQGAGASGPSTYGVANGGGVNIQSGSATITYTTINGNQELGGASADGNGIGGGMNIFAGNATVSNSTICGNLARGADNKSITTISGSDIGQGGGIDLISGTLVIINTILSSNLAIAGANNNAGVGNYGGYALDGGITNIGLLTVTSSAFSGNVAVGGNGGTGLAIGDAEGGALCNFGSLSISGSTFDHNQALAGGGGNCGPGQADPQVDESEGGALSNEYAPSRVAVSSSIFSHNQAIGGYNGNGPATDIAEVGSAEGGAFYNENGAAATIFDSAFIDNQASGGNGNTGSGLVDLVGTGLGGAIVNSYGGVELGPNTLTVRDSIFNQNHATGGDNNGRIASVAALTGVGAGIANYFGGSATVTGSDLSSGQASGGKHNTASGAGAVFAGLGAGGGIFNLLGNYNSSGYGLLNPSVVTVSSCFIEFNQAQAAGGGNAEGGGLANVLSATATLTGSFLIQNKANGGNGAGLGGGAYNDANSSLALSSCAVTQNRANGSPGVGGGIYTLGTFTDAFTIIAGNHASTSGDNIGP